MVVQSPCKGKVGGSSPLAGSRFMKTKYCKRHEVSPHFLRKDTHGWRCKKCAGESVARRRAELRKKAVEYMGGRCSQCEYDKCKSALEFHHLDPSTKSFGISSGSCRSWSRMLKEMKKCILVCANCHREIEYGIRKISLRSTHQGDGAGLLNQNKVGSIPTIAATLGGTYGRYQ